MPCCGDGHEKTTYPMMKKVVHYILLFSAAWMMSGCAMYHYREGNRLYGLLAYHEAIPEYQKALSRKDIPDAQIKLADCFNRVNDVPNATGQYARVVQLQEAQPEHYLAYGRLLMRQGQPDSARKWFDKYLEKKQGDPAVTALSESVADPGQFKKDTLAYLLTAANVNTGESNFSTALLGDTVVFTSDRGSDSWRKAYAWTGRPFLNMYWSNVDSTGKWSPPQALSGDVNGKYHDGPAAFTGDGKTMYFTRNNYTKRKAGKSEQEVVNLKIFQATLKDSSWTDLSDLPFNSTEYSCGHPAVSQDGNTLYFVSDMPGGQGGTDLYVVRKTNGTWGNPVNAGPEVNTPFNEMFPTLYKDSLLYFSSEGHHNMGGLDIFRSVLAEGMPGKPENLNAPLNSTYDDFSITWNDSANGGYLSSNRKQSTVDNIYAFKTNIIQFTLDGLVVEKVSQEPLGGVLVELQNLTTGKKETAMTGADGMFMFKLDANSEYKVLASKDSYFSDSAPVSTMGKTVSEDMHITLKLELEQIIIDKPIVLENIYYDLDKWNIRPDAAAGLDNLVTIMKENPDINIELASHTDSRADDKYNMVLSQKRAQAAVDYIIAHGINQKRIKAKGYGETRLVNRCKNGVQCSEEEHQQNRRTEFKVTSIGGN
jgi:peptidoglycan-associated lipoprotein